MLRTLGEVADRDRAHAAAAAAQRVARRSWPWSRAVRYGCARIPIGGLSRARRAERAGRRRRASPARSFSIGDVLPIIDPTLAADAERERARGASRRTMLRPSGAACAPSLWCWLLAASLAGPQRRHAEAFRAYRTLGENATGEVDDRRRAHRVRPAGQRHHGDRSGQDHPRRHGADRRYRQGQPRRPRSPTRSGNVVVVDPQGTLTADVLTLDLVQETGGHGQGSVFLNANRYRLTGEHFEKQAGQTYAVTNGQLHDVPCARATSRRAGASAASASPSTSTGYGRVKRRDVRGQERADPLPAVRHLPGAARASERLACSRASATQPARASRSSSRSSWTSTRATTRPSRSTSRPRPASGRSAEYRYALSPETLGEVNGSYFNEQIRGASARDDRQLADRRPEHPGQSLERRHDPRPVAAARPQGVRRRAAGERRPLPPRDQRLHVQSGRRRRAPHASFRALAGRVERTFDGRPAALDAPRGTRTSSIPIASSFRCRRASRA